MKYLLNKKLHFLPVLTILVITVSSCEYQEFADTNYPDQIIYMPAAYYNNYMIDAIPEEIGESPTPGYPERFQADFSNNKFNILLAVYRAGIDAEGSFNVNISPNTDTIQSLLAIPEALPDGTTLLTADDYSLVSSLQMNDGERLAKFELGVDLDLLIDNSPTGIYALGVEISSDDREVNPDLAITVIVIDTRIMLPTSAFVFMVTGKSISIRNDSQNGVSYLWDFGDGETSTEKEPEHTYAAAGKYTITLTTVGITGEANQSVLSKTVNIY